MSVYRFIAAIGTPLAGEERLLAAALAAHLEDQWAAGMHGVLVGGTMGLMQLLRDETYERLVEAAAAMSEGRGEVLVGVGDAAYARTLDRIRLVRDYPIDGVVVISPYLVHFSQEDLVSYYLRLADASPTPVFVYHVPGLTRAPLAVETVVRLSEHPNLHGIKCSCDLSWTRRLSDSVRADFRVIVAQPELADMVCRCGVREQLDGVFALAPAWTTAIGSAVERGDFAAAADYQRRLCALLHVMRTYGVFPAFTALLNERGVPGCYAPAPFQPLDDAARRALREEPIVRQLIETHPTASPASPAASRTLHATA